MNSDAHGSIADTIIVGAGVTGLSTALHLRERGVSRVIVLERHHIAAGQSGHAAGMVRALMSHALLAATRVESGIPDQFVEAVGDWSETRQGIGLTADNVARTVRGLLG